MIIDIRKDGKERLVAEGEIDVRYEPHDGSTGKLPRSRDYSPYTKQHHYVATIKRDNAVQGLVVMPHKLPVPSDWVALGKDHNSEYWEKEKGEE